MREVNSNWLLLAMELEQLIKCVTAKLGVLELTRKTIEASLEGEVSEKQHEIERKLRSREEKLDELNELVLKVQEEKLVAGEGIEEVDS